MDKAPLAAAVVVAVITIETHLQAQFKSFYFAAHGHRRCPAPAVVRRGRSRGSPARDGFFLQRHHANRLRRGRRIRCRRGASTATATPSAAAVFAMRAYRKPLRAAAAHAAPAASARSTSVRCGHCDAFVARSRTFAARSATTNRSQPVAREVGGVKLRVRAGRPRERGVHAEEVGGGKACAAGKAQRAHQAHPRHDGVQRRGG